MQHIYWTTISMLLLAIISLGVCRTTTAADSTKTSPTDYEYDYGDDDSHQLNEPEPTFKTEVINMDPPYFENPDIEVEAVPGKSITLNCDARNFRNASNAIIWYKGGTVIVLGRDPVSNRYESMENNAIRIKSVEAADAGDYYCTVLPQKVQLHISLKISGLYIFCNGMDFTNRTMNTKQGAAFSCECKTSAAENVEFKWSLNGERADNVFAKVNKGKLWVDIVEAEHAGVYQCLADDNSSKPAIAALAVHVNYEPKVSTHRHHVNTKLDEDAELYCDYKANPIGIVRWRKMGQEITYSEKYLIKNIMHHTRNRTVLLIKYVDDDDLGEYECQVENTIGSSQAKVYLILEPETPQFEEMEIKNNVVTLHWIVRSLQPLSEAVLDYMLIDTAHWSTVSVLKAKPHNEKGIWKLTHEMELTPGKWQARVKTKNVNGWSKFSPEHNFEILESEDDNQVNMEIPPQDMVMAAGIGLDKGNNKTNSSSLLMPSLIVAFSTILLLLLNKRMSVNL